ATQVRGGVSTARRLRYCNAGHNPPLLRRAAPPLRAVPRQSIELLQEGGVPLGILPDAAFACGEVALSAGDLLVVYSDGLTESFDQQGNQYGEERLLAALERALAAQPNASAALVLQALVADCERFRGGVRQQDDLTCLVLRLLP
ncbi:MAG: PP2C family protein-serine/threonine phosphatase, partial [Terriglobales bacterium]